MQPAQKTDDGGPKLAQHLSNTELEALVTEFEQTMICASEAFLRFAGALLGPQARANNISGPECIILQQLVAAGAPSRVGDLMRFANRDDPSAIKYSLRKLVAAGWVEQVPGQSKKTTAYQVTAEGARVSARLVSLRREHFILSLKDMGPLVQDLARLTRALGMLTGAYDHCTRLVSIRSHDANTHDA